MPVIFQFVVLFHLQEKLVAIVLGMLRQHKYNFVDVYREEACIAVKAVIKQVNLQRWMIDVNNGGIICYKFTVVILLS